jgi:pimeloyl-ACP methyl ester carboxylesterase
MVASELAATVRPDALVLMASCRSPQAISPTHRAAAWLAAHLLPGWSGAPTPLARLAAGLSGPLDRAERDLVVAMLRETDLRFFRWACRVVLRWRPSPPADVPTYHIHGERDRVIRPERTGADRIVPGAGHMVNLTHPDVIDDYLADVIARLG